MLLGSATILAASECKCPIASNCTALSSCAPLVGMAGGDGRCPCALVLAVLMCWLSHALASLINQSHVGRRMSHNPPQSSALSIYDRLGVMVMDENRVFSDAAVNVKSMADLVARDRNHPSVM
jgi:hypothetical protein